MIFYSTLLQVLSLLEVKHQQSCQLSFRRREIRNWSFIYCWNVKYTWAPIQQVNVLFPIDRNGHYLHWSIVVLKTYLPKWRSVGFHVSAQVPHLVPSVLYYLWWWQIHQLCTNYYLMNHVAEDKDTQLVMKCIPVLVIYSLFIITTFFKQKYCHKNLTEQKSWLIICI